MKIGIFLEFGFLFCLLMQGVFSAKFAEFFQLQSLFVQFFVFVRVIINLPALGAFKFYEIILGHVSLVKMKVIIFKFYPKK